ncbi:hypothetical protein ASO20_00885 [Mycoplasma sp. (ex Biomphalaria glabrata)]|uniref:S1 RNA-binding domain-containing protein n=1 Tax=Mycoplasma sp. (ex Biomphalaria glabrata) TaxID=1749074 RepID=UPI00073A808E|nr:S1 RNA-binding domain-containing protein [Mycoplasma sp. (ex Biomphalaria glabrata)]ALV23224.1 hypothetical protein ASO20_00885 [Mycoplasma sp. (ex Biomphalaria glabrata)]
MKIIKGKVTKITTFGVFVKTEDNKKGLLHISDFSDFYIDDLNKYFKENVEYSFIVKQFNPLTNKYNLSYKELNLSLRNTTSFRKIIESQSGFEPLHNLIENFIKE